MFDILVYLFENYVHAAACPEVDQLARKLSAAGFEEDEITEALDWLAGLRSISDTLPLAVLPRPGATRIYAAEEQARLNTECRGFLAFLEGAGALDAATREIIIERTLALSGFSVSLNRLKVIVLMVLWQRELPLDGLIVDELLGAADSGDDARLPQ
jgi:Smg protein